MGHFGDEFFGGELVPIFDHFLPVGDHCQDHISINCIWKVELTFDEGEEDWD